MPESASLRFHTQEVLRFSDQDTQGHVNNAVYSTLFECSRVACQSTDEHLILETGQVVVVAAIAIEFLRELHWPATVDIHLGVSKIGNTSFGFAQEMLLEGTCVAKARSTQVVIDQLSRQPIALSATQRQELELWHV